MLIFMSTCLYVAGSLVMAANLFFMNDDGYLLFGTMVGQFYCFGWLPLQGGMFLLLCCKIGTFVMIIFFVGVSAGSLRESLFLG